MACVYKKKDVPENCSTCLYGPNALRCDGTPVNRIRCAHADRQDDWMVYRLFDIKNCPSYWLDQNRYERV